MGNIVTERSRHRLFALRAFPNLLKFWFRFRSVPFFACFIVFVFMHILCMFLSLPFGMEAVTSEKGFLTWG